MKMLTKVLLAGSVALGLLVAPAAADDGVSALITRIENQHVERWGDMDLYSADLTMIAIRTDANITYGFLVCTLYDDTGKTVERSMFPVNGSSFIKESSLPLNKNVENHFTAYTDGLVVSGDCRYSHKMLSPTRFLVTVKP